MNAKFNLSNSLTLVLLVISLVTLGACQDRTALLVKDSNTSIAIERTGLDGEYDPSGLAKRVAKALAEDSALSGISTVYVAQNGNNATTWLAQNYDTTNGRSDFEVEWRNTSLCRTNWWTSCSVITLIKNASTGTRNPHLILQTRRP